MAGSASLRPSVYQGARVAAASGGGGHPLTAWNPVEARGCKAAPIPEPLVHFTGQPKHRGIVRSAYAIARD